MFEPLREELLKKHPTNSTHIEKVCQEEVNFFEKHRNHSTNLVHERVGKSVDMLGYASASEMKLIKPFSLHALEVCYPGKSDLDYILELLDRVKSTNTPVHGWIEQRWTGRSRSYLSPAFSEDESHVFSWVGCMMYHVCDDSDG